MVLRSLVLGVVWGWIRCFVILLIPMHMHHTWIIDVAAARATLLLSAFQDWYANKITHRLPGCWPYSLMIFCLKYRTRYWYDGGQGLDTN